MFSVKSSPTDSYMYEGETRFIFLQKVFVTQALQLINTSNI